MTNTNPMNRFDAWIDMDRDCSDGGLIWCDDVVSYVQSLQEQGLSPEEILNKIVEELS